jgi:hypothetical protein
MQRPSDSPWQMQRPSDSPWQTGMQIEIHETMLMLISFQLKSEFQLNSQNHSLTQTQMPMQTLILGV